VARDLVARVIERGLNLPDAADRLRTIGGPLPSSRQSAPAALPTLTLAEIYAAQGHRDRAIDTLEGVIAREPEHAAARTLLGQLRDESFPVPPPRMPPEADEGHAEPGAVESDQLPTLLRPPPVPAEPMHMLDDVPLPPRYDVDECVAIPVDPTTLYVYWEVRETTAASLHAEGHAGTLVVRLLVVVPTWDGPRSSTVDLDAKDTVGELFVRDLPAGCLVRAAIGWRVGDAFHPAAHSPALETPAASPSSLVADALVRWTPQGTVPVRPTDPDLEGIARALGLVRREETLARLAALRRGEFLGSSDQWMRAMPAP
jgi:hypothetical protein